MLAPQRVLMTKGIFENQKPYEKARGLKKKKTRNDLINRCIQSRLWFVVVQIGNREQNQDFLTRIR